MGKNNVPVLLIGLGGIGSCIVDDTYGKLKKEGELDFLEALVFDTDQGELSKLQNIPKNCKIQTSTDKTVKYVLDRDENAVSWFPIHKKILSMPLINGAGQIRAVSRLALRSAMKDGKLSEVQTVKDRLYKLGGAADEKGVRIMIVSSLMGGTGSGIFLQIPLYLREIMKSKFSADRIEIQGTFLLPDVLKGSITDMQKVNVYANAYAAMKELNAIILSIAGEGDVVELEYRPDQVENTGNTAIKDWPYDYCFIYDKENSKGNSLATLEDYKKMVAENIYSQVYGPVSDRLYSNFVNEIRGTIRKNCKNIFGGIGIGKLIYPCEETYDYITNKTVLENLKEQLLRIDTSYLTKLEQYERNKQLGNDMEKPDIAEHYIDEFQNLAKEKSNLFFRNVDKQVSSFDENGEFIKDKCDEYLDYLDEIINNAQNDFAQNNDFQLLNRAKIDNSVEGELKNIIDRTESSYKEYMRAVVSRMDGIGVSKADTDFEYYDDNKEKESIFDTFLKKENVYINPVGIRYILYSIKRELDRRRIDVDNDIENKEKEIEKKETSKCSALFKGATNLQGALQHAISADKLPTDKFTFKTMKKFKEEYYDEMKKHYNALMEYSKLRFEKGYYRRTCEILAVLIEEYERMFDKLSDQKVGIEKRIYELENRYKDSLGKTDIFVLATKELKEKLLLSIPLSTRVNSLSNVFPKKMHENLKMNCKYKLKNQLSNLVGYDTLFNTLILEGCKDGLKKDPVVSEIVDINIVRAIETEYKFYKEMGNDIANRDFDVYIKEKIKALMDRTHPFAPNADDASDFTVWGINDNLRLPTESASDKPKIEVWIDETVSGGGKSICADSTYSKYEITYMHARYGLMISDFAKFYAGKNGEDDGEYYVCYNKVIKDVVDDSSGISRNIEITPHIDRLWHKTLLDLNDNVNIRKDSDKAKAFIIGLTMRYIIVEKKQLSESKYKLEYKRKIGTNTPISITAKNENVSGNISKLYEGLKYNPELIERINEEIEKYIKNLKENADTIGDIQNIAKDEMLMSLIDCNIDGYKEVKTALDLFVKLYEENKNLPEKDKNDIFGNLFSALIEIIEGIVGCYAGLDVDIVKENSKIVLKNLLKNSKLAGKLKEATADYNTIIGPVKDKIKEYEEK